MELAPLPEDCPSFQVSYLRGLADLLSQALVSHTKWLQMRANISTEEASNFKRSFEEDVSVGDEEFRKLKE